MSILCFVIHLVLRYLKSKVSQYDFGKGGAINQLIKQMAEKTLDTIKMIVQSIGINIAVGELSARPLGLTIATFGDSAISLKTGASRRNLLSYTLCLGRRAGRPIAVHRNPGFDVPGWPSAAMEDRLPFAPV